MKSEFSYTMILTACLGGFLWWLKEVVTKFYSLPLAKVVESCSDLVTIVIQSGSEPLKWLVSGLAVSFLMFLILKIATSLVKTHQKVSKLMTITLEPTHYQLLSRVCQQNQLPLNRFTTFHDPQPQAFTVGFWRPQIILSHALFQTLTKPELEAVILHEWYHARHHHPLLYLVAEVVGTCLAFIPTISELAVVMKLKLEQQADAWAKNQQHTPQFVTQALRKMTINPQNVLKPDFHLWPAFALMQTTHRLDSLIGKDRGYIFSPLKLLVSSLVITSLVTIWWYPLPMQVQASSSTQEVVSCNDQHLCSTHCYSQTSYLTPFSRSTTLSSR